MRLIDADAIPYTMIYKENWLAGTGMEKQGAWKDDIDAMPTIEERKQGKWVCSDDMYETAVCSSCGWDTTEPWTHIRMWFEYCPKCGALMMGTP